ncbi:mCG1026238 [Mus musculus]|nr:mCG1026238 [Mus musculus]
MTCLTDRGTRLELGCCSPSSYSVFQNFPGTGVPTIPEITEQQPLNTEVGARVG